MGTSTEADLPKFQTIYEDPKETLLTSSDAWSRSLKAQNIDPPSDLLLYEQIISRDQLNSLQLVRERNGYEPMSKFGFSNKEYLTRLLQDLNYYKELKNTRMKSITNTSQGTVSKSIWGDGYSGYGNGFTNTVTNVVIGGELSGEYISLNDVYDVTMQHDIEELVPIRLEFDTERDRFSLRDTFIWNKNEKLVKLEEFVMRTLEDYRFAQPTQYCDAVLNAIREQLNEFQTNPFKHIRNANRIGGDDLRIKIRLDIVVGQNELLDTVEWDISNPDNDPEEFAQVMCEELQLPGEFMTAIAHSIREQVHVYHKALALIGYKFDGSFIDDDDIRSRFLPVITLDEVFRASSDCKTYTPNLLEISAPELERLEKDKDRDTRRKRRQGRFNRRGAVAFPDAMPDLNDIPKTFRIPVPSTILPGGVDLGPPVGSYTVVSTSSQQPRPPKPRPVEAPCRIITHERGRSLLLSIRLRAPVATAQKAPATAPGVAPAVPPVVLSDNPTPPYPYAVPSQLDAQDSPRHR